MSALEVIGAAGIWGFLLACGLFLGVVASALVLVALDRWKISRAVWRFKHGGWVSKDELDSYFESCASEWWRGIRHEKTWSRSRDFKAGIEAASRHLLRDYLHIVKDRRLRKPSSGAAAKSEGGEA